MQRLPRAACGCARCCATRPPASCTRASTSASSVLFVATVSSRSTTSSPTPEVPARQRVPGVLVRRRPLRPRVPRSASCGRSRAATSSGPTASASRPSPRTRVILGTFLVIGVTGFLTEAFRIAARGPARRSRSGRSSATRSRRPVRRLVASATLQRPATAGCGASTSLAFLRVPRACCPPRSCGTWSRRR